MISAKKVIIGAVALPGPGISPSAFPLERPDAGDGEPDGHTLPPRNPAFTGRDEMLAEVARRLADGPVAVVAVRGLGGMGKSQVALEYAHRMRASGRYRMAGWVRADSAVTVAEDVAAMAPLLGLPADGPAGEVATAVMAALGSRRDWLMVFDNAQAPGDLAGMLPGGAGHVLITSRNRTWSGVALQLDLEVFSRAESVAFLCKRSGRAESEEAGALARELGDLPLALAQAAAYIDARAVTIGGYLALYRDPVLARRLRDEGLDSGEYPASVARTWLLTFGLLSGDRPAAVELLRLCAFLDPDDIDLGVLAAGATKAGEVLAAALGDALQRAETAGALAGASLVTATAEGRMRVHRLVQAVTRDQLDDDQTATWSRRALSLVAAVFPSNAGDPRSWPVCASLAPHVEAVAAHTACYADLAIKRGTLLSELGVYLSGSARPEAAMGVLGRALAILEAVYGPDHPDLAPALTVLGAVQFDLGELPAARASLERALAVVEAVYGPDDPDLAGALTILGVIQLDLGELPAARATLERALAIAEAAYGPDHPQLLFTLYSLGAAQQQDLGERQAARATQERALAIAEAAYGPDHPRVAVALNALGLVQLDLRELSAARGSLERALAIAEAAYGPDHPQVAATLVPFGLVQQDLGELPAASGSLERALAIVEAGYGPDSPQVATALESLGDLQRQLGELPAARATLERALAIFEATYGPDHPDVASVLQSLGDLQRQLGELPAARATLERALAIFEAAYGPDYADLARTLKSLEDVQRQLGRERRGSRWWP